MPMLKRFLLSIPTLLPHRTPRGLAKMLVARANAERDAARFQAAAALYEEALRLCPLGVRFQIQYGHMLKESGDFNGAERAYLEAYNHHPNDADLSFQLGHFYRIAGTIDQAASHYRRAAELRPGWREPLDKLAELGEIGEVASSSLLPPLPELLPIKASAEQALRDGFHMRRLGATRSFTRGSYRRSLRGIEAIRGFVVSTVRFEDMVVLIDGVELCRQALQHTQLSGGQSKQVFNIWYDFGGVAPGVHKIELRALSRMGLTRSHRLSIDVVPPLATNERPESDAIVEGADGSSASLSEQINARPSNIRLADRAISPPPATVLVQRVDQLGDLACSIPAILRLREHFPHARLIGLLSAANAPLAKSLDIFDAIYIADFREEIADGRKIMVAEEQIRLRDALTANQVDLAIDLGETSLSRPLLRLSGAPVLCGFKDREFPWLSLGFELNSHDPGNHLEMVAHGQKLVALVDAVAAMMDRTSYSRPAAVEAAPDRGRRPYAVLHTGARLAYSRWPSFGMLAQLLLANTDLDIIVMGEELPEGLIVSSRVTAKLGILAFEDFQHTIAQSALFIGNDSGPKHLAALYDVPTISLHMARLNWNEWGQTGSGLIISRRVPCAGCGISTHGEECGKEYACIRAITAQEVLYAARRLLGDTYFRSGDLQHEGADA